MDPLQALHEPAGVYSLYEVIGVVANTRSGLVWDPDETMLYLPLADDRLGHTETLLQFTGPPSTTLPLVLAAASAGGKHLGINIRGSLDEARNLLLLPYRCSAAVAAALGLLALLMAVVGLYGVMTFVVSQRVREIGIRTALGATGKNIVGYFLRQGMRLVTIGLALGCIGGIGLAFLLSKIFFVAEPFDPLTCGSVGLLLAIVSLLACWLPSRRAAKVDPMVALRTE